MKALKAPEWKTPYNHDTLADAMETGTKNTDPSLTQQSHAEDADINTIVRRFGLTGQLPNIPVPPTYQDFQDVMDYQQAQNKIAEANASFYLLPAPLRAQFNNDPGTWLREVDAATENGNIQRLSEMGLQIDPDLLRSDLKATPPNPPTGEQPKAPAEPSKTATEPVSVSTVTNK